MILPRINAPAGGQGYTQILFNEICYPGLVAVTLATVLEAVAFFKRLMPKNSQW